MLSCYITPDEFRAYYDVSRFATDSQIAQALRASTYELEETLRARGFAPSRLQPPLMFDALDAYVTATKSADYSSASLECSGTESRFVVETTNDAAALFTLEGSPDNTNWMPVRDIYGTTCNLTTSTAGVYTSLFLTRFPFYRMIITTSESVTYRAYLTDSGPDKTIRSRAMYFLFVPFADKDSNLASLADVALEEYRSAMDSAVFSVTLDTDGDGIGDTDVYDVQPFVRWRR